MSSRGGEVEETDSVAEREGSFFSIYSFKAKSVAFAVVQRNKQNQSRRCQFPIRKTKKTLCKNVAAGFTPPKENGFAGEEKD